MIHHKKLRWERQKQDLDTKLQIKEQEYESQRTALEQKNVEVFYTTYYLSLLIKQLNFQVDNLKKLLENMETSTKDIMKKYENEIDILNQQV